jgi:hypothetical protein
MEWVERRQKELAPHYVPPWAERTPWAWTNPPVLAASTHPPFLLKRLCRNAVHGSTSVRLSAPRRLTTDGL